MYAAERAGMRPGSGRAVEVGGRRLALFNLEERIIALDDRCPRDGRPLSQGRQVDGGRVVECTGSTWVSGRGLSPEGPGVQTYPVRTAGRGRDVEVRC